MSWLDGRSIHQVMVTAAPGDAITNSVMEIRSLLRTYGKSEVFACNIHNELLGDVLSISAYDHHAPGDDPLLLVVSRLAGALIIAYHNIAPSSYFATWAASTARLLELGRRSLKLL